MKQDIHVTHRILVKKHLTPEVVRTVQIDLTYPFAEISNQVAILLLRSVIKLLITVIGSSFHRYLIMYYI